MDVVVDTKGFHNIWSLTKHRLSDENGHQLLCHPIFARLLTLVRPQWSNTSAATIKFAAEINVDWKSIDIDWQENTICETSTKDTNSLAFDKLKSPFDWGANHKLFITGGSGFIGSNFVKFALGNGYKIIALPHLCCVRH